LRLFRLRCSEEANYTYAPTLRQHLFREIFDNSPKTQDKPLIFMEINNINSKKGAVRRP
jgi:hypothetical protein